MAERNIDKEIQYCDPDGLISDGLNYTRGALIYVKKLEKVLLDMQQKFQQIEKKHWIMMKQKNGGGHD